MKVQALVDDRSPNELPKKLSCDKAENANEKVGQSATCNAKNPSHN